MTESQELLWQDPEMPAAVDGSSVPVLVCVLPLGPFDESFCYRADTQLQIGDIVEIPLGLRLLLGVVTEQSPRAALKKLLLRENFQKKARVVWEKYQSDRAFIDMDNAKFDVNIFLHDTVCQNLLKKISRILPFNLGRVCCNFLEWVAAYTLIPRGMVLKMMLSEKTVFRAAKTQAHTEILDQLFHVISAVQPCSTKKSQEDSLKCPHISCRDFRKIELNKAQLVALERIVKNGARPFLLHGVTGSGKTEIYLSILQDILKNQKQILILLPEIAITYQISRRMEEYLGFAPTIWNSSISPKNRRKIWRTVISGDKCVILGARSALFLPFQNLGLIVVDEEHDSSYKQEEHGFYHARDMAIVLGALAQIPVLLASATPSIESYSNACSGKYGYALVENRFGSAQFPSLELIDMHQNKPDTNYLQKNKENKSYEFISQKLLSAIKDTIAKQEQCLIYVNRRGYSPITLCKLCGEKISCPNCTSWMVYHKNHGRIICHHCGHNIKIPHNCLYCKAPDSYVQLGCGVERIYDELQKKLPTARIQIASSDTISSDKKFTELYHRIQKGEIDIVIGTQILSKGHHFPNITLVGIIDGDCGLYVADFRSSEKVYQLINQVAGRAGRADKPGKILIQTLSVNHSIYDALRSGDMKKFLNLEMISRQENNLPPFSRSASIIISGTNVQLTEEVARKIAKIAPEKVKLMGPAPATLFMLRGRARWRILLSSQKHINLSELIRQWIGKQKTPKNVKIQIDIDPINFS
ncbi:MAG: primosomal protein N' [Holosporaceae bacterium]|nr:primosomal protein N' [Holosporaceae bacterium]